MDGGQNQAHHDTRARRFRRNADCWAPGRRATLDMIVPHVKPGVSTGFLDKMCHDFILDHGAIPAPLNYRGYPKSICTYQPCRLPRHPRGAEARERRHPQHRRDGDTGRLARGFIANV